MKRLLATSLSALLVCLSAINAAGGETKEEQLVRLKSYGFLITDGGIGGTDIRIVVPYDCGAEKREIDDLRDYCLKHSPKSEVVFFGPVMVDNQLRSFQMHLRQSHIRHMAAVGLNIVHTSTSRILRVNRVGSPAKEIGLRVGDVIVGIGEYRWPESDSHDSFRYAMKRQLPGQNSTLFVKRDGKLITFPLKWKESIPHRTLTNAADNKAVNRSGR